ncbi:hypothetical protein MFRU_019g00720 [Monilinia fructicola]|nr:hypothetical protein MFRU_019g00720 [Monilinia fructicola]
MESGISLSLSAIARPCIHASSSPQSTAQHSTAQHSTAQHGDQPLEETTETKIKIKSTPTTPTSPSTIHHHPAATQPQSACTHITRIQPVPPLRQFLGKCKRECKRECKSNPPPEIGR